MPNNATPTGRPIASTDPKATMRIMIANARPNSSVDGCSTSREQAASDLDTKALHIGGDQLAQVAADLGDTAAVEVLSHVDGGVGDPAGRVATSRDLELPARRVRALHRGDTVDRGGINEHRLHRRTNLRGAHSLFGLEHDLARLWRTAPVAESGLHQCESLGRLEAVERSLLSVRVANRSSDAIANEQCGDPKEKDEPAPIVAPRTQSTKHDGFPSVSVAGFAARSVSV